MPDLDPETQTILDRHFVRVEMGELERMLPRPVSRRIRLRWSEDDDRAFDLAYRTFILARHDR